MINELGFNFQEYEIDSEFDGKPHAFTKAFWNGEEREVALALVDQYVRFCEVDKLDSGEWNFAINERINWHSATNINPAFVENVFHTGLKSQRFARVFCLRTSGGTVTQWVLIEPENHVILRIGGGDRHFEARSDLSLLQNSISEWYAEIKKWEEGDSDLGFSLRWNSSSNFDRAWSLTQLASGTRIEMERVATLIIYFDDAILKDAENNQARRVSVTVMIAGNGKKSAIESIIFWDWFIDANGVKSYAPSYSCEYQTSKQSYPLWEIFLEHFKPQVDVQICKKYSSAKASPKYMSLEFGADLDANMHQRLELRLELAKWLQGKVPDDQIDSLLA